MSASVASEGGLKLVRGLRVKVFALKPNVGLPEDIISHVSRGDSEIKHYLDLNRLIRTNVMQTQLEIQTRIRRIKFAVREYLISKLDEKVSCLETPIGVVV